MAWYVATIETNCERRAEKLAPRFGIEPFLPLIEQQFNVSGRILSRPVLMFPGYLFVKFEDLNQWKRARREGFIFLGLLGAGEDGVDAIRDKVVDDLKARQVNGVIPLMPTKSAFHKGQIVRVARGRYADVKALVQSSVAHRVSLLMTMFNQEIVVELDEGLVIAA